MDSKEDLGVIGSRQALCGGEGYLISQDVLVDEAMFDRSNRRDEDDVSLGDVQYLKKMAFSKPPKDYNPHEVTKKHRPNIRSEHEYTMSFCVPSLEQKIPSLDKPPVQEEHEFKPLVAEEVKAVIEEANKAPAVLWSGFCDKGNDLLSPKKLNQLYENLDEVFGEPPHEFQGVVWFVEGKFPNRKIEWRGKQLYVDGCKLKDFYNKHLKAHKALQEAAGKKVADKVIGTLLVKKLKKLF